MCCPKRYIVVSLAFLGFLLSLGMRSVYAIVIVHVVRSNASNTEFDSLFPACTTGGTDRDLAIFWTGKMVYATHTAYFIGWFLNQLPGGIMAARISSKYVSGTGVLTSGILFILLPLAIKSNVYLVIVMRFLQGLVEGCVIPAINGIISGWAPRSERSRMLAVAYAGAYLSPGLAMILSGVLTCYLSWDAIIYIYGGMGIIWAVLWMIFVYETPDLHPNLSFKERELFRKEGQNVKRGSRNIVKRIPWRKVLCSFPVTALCAGSFCRNWVFAMLITEQPQYFKDVYNMGSADIGFLSALPHVLMSLFVLIGAVAVDMMIKHEIVSITVARKLAQIAGFGTEGVCVLILGFINDSTQAMVLLCVGVGLSGFAISGFQVNPLDMAPQFASVLTGVSRLGTVGSSLSTALAGELTENHSLEEWQRMFIIAGCVHIGGVIYYVVFASGKRQPWADGDGESVPIIIDDDSIDDSGVYSYKDKLFSSSTPAEQRTRKEQEYGSITRDFMLTI